MSALEREQHMKGNNDEAVSKFGGLDAVLNDLMKIR